MLQRNDCTCWAWNQLWLPQGALQSNNRSFPFPLINYGLTEELPASGLRGTLIYVADAG